MLSLGSSGSNVKKAQELLNKKTILPPGEKALIADGKYGTLTSNRVRLYQIQNKLNATGNIDDATGLKLGLTKEEVIAQVPVIASQPVVNMPSSFPSLAEPSFFEKHKKHIMIGGGLAVIAIAAIFFMPSKKMSSIAVKSNPRKRKKL